MKQLFGEFKTLTVFSIERKSLPLLYLHCERKNCSEPYEDYRCAFKWSFSLIGRWNSVIITRASLSPLTYFHKEQAFLLDSGMLYLFWVCFSDLDIHTIILLAPLWPGVSICGAFLEKLNSNYLFLLWGVIERIFFSNRKENIFWEITSIPYPVLWPHFSNTYQFCLA